MHINWAAHGPIWTKLSIHLECTPKFVLQLPWIDLDLKFETNLNDVYSN